MNLFSDIKLGEICLIDPNNNYFEQSELGPMFVKITRIRSFIFKQRYVGLVVDEDGCPVDFVNYVFSRNMLLKMDKPNQVLIRYPSDMPVFSETDLIVLDTLLMASKRMENEDIEFRNNLESLRRKLLFYKERSSKIIYFKGE